MNMKNFPLTSTIFAFVFFVAWQQFVICQTNQEIARDKGKQAIRLEDAGKFSEAIKLLEEAQKLDESSIAYPYELGYSYYGLNDYKKAITYLEGIINHPNVYEEVFQLLGNCYDNLGNSDKALNTYDAGLVRFPKSGKLFMEKGTVYWNQKEDIKALPYYEQGIQADPSFASNYYRAAIIYCHSKDEVWGMVYGEIFMNLERNTDRTAEISKLLYDTYKSEILYTAESLKSVSFCHNIAIDPSDLSNTKNMKLPFGTMYEMTMAISAATEKCVDINSLNRIRTRFVENYYKLGHATTRPNVLFDYQNQVLKAGHLDAYNHWIVMKGDEDGFTEWQTANNEKWKEFVKWFGVHKIIIDSENKFYSGQ
jgi:tetratricopeptide (TPR) repeat protein